MNILETFLASAKNQPVTKERRFKAIKRIYTKLMVSIDEKPAAIGTRRTLPPLRPGDPDRYEYNWMLNSEISEALDLVHLDHKYYIEEKIINREASVSGFTGKEWEDIS